MEATLLVDEADAFMRDSEDYGIMASADIPAILPTSCASSATTTRSGSTFGAQSAGRHRAWPIRSWIAPLRSNCGKLPNEDVMRLRHAEPGLFDDLASKLARFADDNREALPLA